MSDDSVLLQGHLLLHSSIDSHESQKKVYVILSDASLKYFDEDPNARRDAKLHASYDLRFVKVLDCTESKHPKAFTVEVRSSPKCTQSFLEFTSPTNSVKFQWMKQLIGATADLNKTVGEMPSSNELNEIYGSSDRVNDNSRNNNDNNTRSNMVVNVAQHAISKPSLKLNYNASMLNILSSYKPHDSYWDPSDIPVRDPSRPRSTALIVAPPEGK